MKGKLEKLRILVMALAMGLATSVVNAGKLNPVAWWKFDEGSGATAVDSSGFGHHGLLKSGVVWAGEGSPMNSDALSFNGRTDGVPHTTDPGNINWVDVEPFDVVGPGITLAAWIRPEGFDQPNARIITKQKTWLARDIWWMLSTFGADGTALRMRLKTDDGGSDDGTTTMYSDTGYLQIGVWSHVAGTYDGSKMRLYHNGVEITSTDKTGTIQTDPTAAVAIGNSPLGDPGGLVDTFHGLIDEVSVFNRGLTEEEITLLYRQGVAAFTDPMLLKLSSIVREAEATAKELKPQEAIPFIESKIAEFERWTGKNLNHVGLHYRLLRSDLYFLLAKAKEAAGLPNKDIAAAYKHATLSYKNGGTALTWLFENVHTDEYKSSIKAAIQKLHDGKYIYVNITKQLESTGNWPAFELFLDTVFGEAENPIAVAKSVENGLRADSTWGQKYLEYCRGKPQLKEYTLERLRKVAEAYVAKEDFKKAGETYRDIIKLHAPGQQGSTLELKVCECLFNDGKYQSAISKLDRFLARNKASNRSLSKEAILMKGRCYIQLGEINKAANEFFTLTVEYPKTKQAPEASFFIGYCYMLQRKFEEATEALNLVVKDYPESSYVSKARLCLLRIENMTE